jgi:hypothetical protein
MLHGTGAYAIHRRGMIELLGRYWPDDAPDTLELTNELRAGKGESSSLGSVSHMNTAYLD